MVRVEEGGLSERCLPSVDKNDPGLPREAETSVEGSSSFKPSELSCFPVPSRSPCDSGAAVRSYNRDGEQRDGLAAGLL